MKKLFVLFSVLSVLALSGCTTTIITRSVNQNYSNDVERKKTMDAITYVLSNNGFEIKNVNESFGVVTTEWRLLRDEWANFGWSLLTADEYSVETYSDWMQLQFNITDEGYAVTPKTKTKETTSGWFYTSSHDTDVVYASERSTAGKITVRIMKEINELLGIQSNPVWTEKKITVEN